MTATDTSDLGWHFSDGREAFGQKRPLVPGETLSVDGPLVMCWMTATWPCF